MTDYEKVEAVLNAQEETEVLGTRIEENAIHIALRKKGREIEVSLNNTDVENIAALYIE